LKLCPRAEASAEPICTIGPSRPAEPPDPMQIDETSAFTATILGRILPPRDIAA
jgi:hypothetical protein